MLFLMHYCYVIDVAIFYMKMLYSNSSLRIEFESGNLTH